MRIFVCFLAVVATAIAIDVDWSKIKSMNRYVEAPFELQETPDSRIVGGHEAFPHSFPYQAALFINVGDGTGFCGGSLIAPDWILTAAHCVDVADSAQVVLGAHNVYEVEETQEVFWSNDLVVHESWQSDILRNDVALVKLPRPARIGAGVQIIPLADRNAGNFAQATAVLTGWGRTTDDSQHISPTLQQIFLTVIENSSCSRIFTSQIIQDTHICTSGIGGIGACNGDSGGPLVVNGIQVGIVSFGFARCAFPFPSVFARVTEYRDWIATHSGV